MLLSVSSSCSRFSLSSLTAPCRHAGVRPHHRRPLLWRQPRLCSGPRHARGASGRAHCAGQGGWVGGWPHSAEVRFQAKVVVGAPSTTTLALVGDFFCRLNCHVKVSRSSCSQAPGCVPEVSPHVVVLRRRPASASRTVVLPSMPTCVIRHATTHPIPASACVHLLF